MEHPLKQFVNCPKCGSSHFFENNIKSKKCADCRFVYYFNPSAATVAVIINDKNQVLVCKRAKDPARGSLDLPGGFVDMHETGEEAVAREVKEETGLEVTCARYLFSLPNLYLYSGFEVHTLDLFYLCGINQYKTILAQDDVAATYFIDIDKLDANQFGLNSIKKGVEWIISHRNELVSNMY